MPRWSQIYLIRQIQPLLRSKCVGPPAVILALLFLVPMVAMAQGSPFDTVQAQAGVRRQQGEAGDDRSQGQRADGEMAAHPGRLGSGAPAAGSQDDDVRRSEE